MYPVSGEPFNFFESSDTLAELGASFPMYFMLVKCLFLYLAVSICMASLPCLIANALQDKKKEWDNESIITGMTPGNYGNPFVSHFFEIPPWQAGLHILATCVFLILSPLAYKKLREKAVELDISRTTPSDFTVWVKGLPEEYTHEELEEFFITHSKNPIQITNIVSTYDIQTFLKTNSKLLQCEKELEIAKESKIVEKKCCCIRKKKKSIEECLEEIAELKKNLKKLASGIDKKKVASVAFISFRTQIQSREIARQWDISSLKKFLQKVKLLISKDSSSLFKGKLVTAETAPEPSDVYWENLSASYNQKQIRRVVTYMIAGITISSTFIALYFINQFNKSNFTDQTSENLSSSRVASAFSSLLVMLINRILSVLIRIYSKQEMHHTWSTYNLSVSNKSVIAMFLNTGIIPLVVNYDAETMWFNTGGLAYNIFWIQVANAVVNPLVYLFSPMYQIKRLKRWVVTKKGLGNISQQSANFLFEGPEVDLADRYANIIKSVLVAGFYAGLVPAGVLVTAFGIVFEAAVFKIFLIKVNKRPREQGQTLALEAAKWIRRVPGFYSIGIVIFYYSYIPDIQNGLIIFVALIWTYNFCYVEYFFDSKFQDKSLEVLKSLHKDGDKENDYYMQIPEFYTVLFT